jgi:hypothetical protein
MPNVIYVFSWSALSGLFALAEEVVVLSREEPGRRVVPDIPTVIQDEVVFGLAGQDAIEGLRVQVAVLVATDDVGGKRFLALQEEQFLCFPGEVGMGALISSVLGTNVFAYFLSVYPRSLGVYVDLI